MIRFVLVLCAATLLFALPAGATEKPLGTYLPGICAQGWVAEGKVATYNPKDLYKYINGEAEMYLPYGFERAATVMYTRRGDKENGIVANIFKMGSLLDAFGIYGNYRAPATEPVDIGGEGFVEESQLMFYKDRYFVQLMASGTVTIDRPLFMECAAAISKNLPGPSIKPPEGEFLKIPGAVARSEKYYAQGLLGYGFFGKGMTAEATINGRPVKAFVIFTDSGEAAKRVFDDYSKHLRKSTAAPEVAGGRNGLSLSAIDPLYKGVLLRQSGRYIAGVAGLAHPSEGLPVIDKIIKRLPGQ